MANLKFDKVIPSDVSSISDYDSNIEQPKSLQLVGYIPSGTDREELVFYGGGSDLGKSKFDTGILEEQIPQLSQIRAERQPWYEQAGAFANQAVVGEIIGGTLMSVGALADPIIDLFKTSDDYFHNALYDIGNNISKWSQETTPIYQTGERFNDSGWWFQNGVSVASSLSMLLPGMAAARGAKFLTGLTKLGTTASGLVETGIGALAMRHAENFREASGVFDEIYNKGIENGLPEDEARRIASESASTDYNLNYLNTAFDFVQLAAILRPLKGLTRNVGRLPYALAKAEGKLPTSKLGRAGYWLTESGKALPEQFSEGLEEVVNQISQYEGEREGNIKLGLQQDDGSTWQQRVGEYLGKPDTVDSFIWGIIGGVGFKQFAKVGGWDQTSNVINRKLNEVASREKTVQRYAEVAEAISNKGQLKDDEGNVIRDFSNLTDEDRINLRKELLKNSGHNLGINSSVAGNTDLLLAQLDNTKFHKTLIDSGLASEETINDDIQTIKKEVLRAEDLFKKHYTKFFESPIKQSVKDRLINESVNNDFKIQSNLEKIRELEGEYSSLYSKDAIVQTKLEDLNLNPTIQKEALAVAQADLMLELNDAKSDSNTTAIQDIEKSLESLRKKESKLVVDKPVSIKGIDDRLIDNLAYQEILKEHNQRLTEKLVKADSKENVQRATEEEVAFEAEQKRVLEENRKLQEEKVKQDRIKKATEAKWNKLIDKAVNDNELDSIIDQLDKAGEPTANYLDRINRKRESLKVTPKEKVTEVKPETPFGEVVTPTPEDITKSTEELESESETITKDIKDPNHIDDKKAKSISSSINDINEDLKDSNGGFTTNQSGEIIYENSKISNGFNALAHQDRAYERTVKGKVVTYTDISDELNESTYKPLLNPNKFKEGTEVELRVDDSDDIEIYDPRVEGKKVTTWGAFKVGLDPNSKEYIDNVPIRMYVDGKPVNVFYHTTSWMNEENIAGSIDKDIENTSKIRQEIVKQGTYKTKVVQTSNGVLFLTKDNRQIKLQEAIGEDDIQIGTVTGDGSIKFDSGKFAEGLLNQEKIKGRGIPGSTVIIVPVKNGTLAIPVNRQKIGNNEYSDRIKQSILSAIDIYVEQDNEAKVPILKETGLDITTPEGLERYLNMFINTYNTNKQFLNDAIKGLPKGTNDRYFSIHKGEIEFFDGTLTGRVLSVSNRNSKFRDSFINALEKGLPNFYLNTSLEALNSNRSVVFINSDRTVSEPISYRTFLLNTTTTNIKGFKVDEVNGKPVYSYTIQPVVRLDFSGIVSEEVISTKQFNTELAKKIQDKLQKLYPEIKLNITNNPIWEQGNNVLNQREFTNQVNYTLKSVNILLSDKAKQVFVKGEKAKWDLNKILTELAIPKEQKQLLLDLGIADREQLALELASKYGYTVEINTAKEQTIPNKEEWVNKVVEERGTTKEKALKEWEELNYRNTQYYSNLTVPGGTNYIENEISTPLITPSIKGHAQFSTDKGIGWFRSDDQLSKSQQSQLEDNALIGTPFTTATEIKEVNTKTRRILEIQSDLFQKGRDKEDLVVDFYTPTTEEEFLENPKGEEDYNTRNSFLQLLNKDNNWVTFFIKSIIQDSAKKGYEKVLFPKGETAAKIEGHETLANQIINIDKRIADLYSADFYRIEDSSFVVYENGEWVVYDKLIDGFRNLSRNEQGAKALAKSRNEFNRKLKNDNNDIIEKLEKQKQELKSQGIEKLKPIEAFYEIKVGNILEKQFGKDNVKTITDEYGNQWREITINQARDLQNILLQKDEANRIIGQANIKAMTVLVDAVNQKQDTLPHEYAHHYIAWFRNTPIVQEGIKKWGSEEALVESIGKQVVRQKGEAYNWWNKFVKWILEKFNKLSNLQKEELTQILTDAFLAREDLSKVNYFVERGVDKSVQNLLDNLDSVPDEDFLPSTTQVDAIEKATSKYIIKGLGVTKQEQVTNHIARVITKEKVQNPNKDINVIRTEVLERYKNQFETASKEIEEKYPDEPRWTLRNDRLLKPLISNWSTIQYIVNTKIKKINNLVGEVNDELDIDLQEESSNEKNNWDKNSYEDGVKASVEVKRLLADIDAATKNILGEQDVMDWQVVYQTLQQWTAGYDADFELLVSKINEYSKAYPWVNSLVNKLNSADEKLRNRFVGDMTNHYTKHIMNMWSKDLTKKEDNFRCNVQLVNENSIVNQILENWVNNLQSSPIVSVNEDREYYIGDEERTKLLAEYDAFKDGKNPQLVRDWLEKLGVKVTDGLWKTMVGGNYVVYKDPLQFSDLIRNNQFIVDVLYKNIKSRGESSLLANPLIEGNTAAEYFAKQDSRFSENTYTSSHRAGNKTINSFGKNKFLTNWIRDLKTTDLARVQQKFPFQSPSYWNTKLAEGDATFVRNFDYATVSIEALRKHNTKPKEGKELHNLIPAEYEGYEIIGLQASIKDITGGSARVIFTLYLTTSDKSTQMLIQHVAAPISMNMEGNLNDSSISFLYEQLVLPEIRRIKQFEDLVSKGVNINNKELQNGGHQFYFLPILNAMNGMWNEDGTINVNVESPEFVERIKGTIREYVDSAVNSKLEKWEQYGITADGKPEHLAFNVLKEKRVLDGVAKENYVRAAATDMVFQYLVSNANCFTTIIGDPALFFKSKVIEKKANDSGIAKGNYIKNRYLRSLPFEERVELAVKEGESIFINVGKRLAMDIAPATEGNGRRSNTYRQVFAADRAVDSLELEKYKALLGEEKALAYSKDAKEGILKEGTNAQEFTTLKEDLYVRNTYGELPSGFYNAVAEIIDREVAKGNHYYTQAILDGLTPEFKEYFEHMVLQVTKPRYGWNEPDNTLGMMMRTYIKTSAYPLTPELTANLEMDKIRVMMEKNGIDRLAFSSGIKVGNLAKPLEIWDKDGNIREDITPEEVEGATKSLSRLGFGIQQDVPYDELKDAINRVSQADKNLFLNIKDVEGFVFNGKTYKGEELEKEYLKHYQELYTLGREKLHRRLNVVKDSSGNVVSLDREALKIAIREEAEQRGYPITDIEALDLDDALDTIAFMPSADKYESLLNSLVKNSILKMKFKGKSFVLSTEEGFQTKKTKGITEEEVKKRGIKGIIHTNNWNGSLDPGHFEDEKGNRLTGEQLRKAWDEKTTVIVKKPAQIIIPWKFRDNKGNIVDITKFVKDGKLDPSKLPTELLQMFGMRIPNQGLNSQSWIEVVGFLPHSAGDIVVASRDYLAQMGSDFDVDKLYMYMYNTYFDGKKFEKINFDSREDIEKLEENVLANMIFETDEVEARKLDKKARFLENVNDVWSKSLQNKLLDIHIAIQANPNEEVQKQIYEPLGMGVFKDAADEIASSRKIDKYWTPLSDEYQMEKRLNAASGKSLTGDFSNGSMFNAVAQKKDLYIRRFVDGSWERASIKFGKNVSKTGSLSEVRTLDGKYYISDVISWLQSCAVDNEKEQVLDKLNLTSETSKYAKLLAQLGFVEEVAYFTAQPIVVEYFNLLRSKTSSLSGYNANAQEETIEELEKKYAVPDSEKYSKEYSRGLGLDWKSMRGCILNPEGVTDFNYIQLAALEQLQYLDKFATDLQTLQSSINTDSKGLDKNLLGTLAKELSIDRITGKRQNAPLSIGNAINVLGRIENGELVPETIQGFATVYGLFENNKLWNSMFPYSSQGVNYVFNRIEQILGKEEVGAEGRTVLRRDIWKAYKSYLFTLKETGLYRDNIDGDRNRLFIDKYEDNKLVKPSLATITNTIKNSQQFKNNPFIQRLNPSIQKNGQPSIVKMNASLDQAGELAVVSAVADLYVNDRPIEGTDYTTRSYFEDLVRAAYLSGGIQEAVQYVRFIPPSYLYSTNFASTLQSIVTENRFEDSQFMQVPSSESEYWVLPSFIIQYVQNNTDRIPQLKRKIGSSKGFESQIKGKVESNDIKGGSIKVVKFNLTDDSLYVTRKGKQVPPEFLTIHDTKRLKSLSKNILFRHTGEFSNDGYPIYHRIDNLGTFAFEEYNANLPIDSVQTSIIEQYNANHKVTNKLVTSPRKQNNYSERMPNSLRASNISEVLEVKSGNVGTIQSILEDISYLSDDKFYTLVADTILDNFDKIDVDTKFSTNLEGKRGRYYNKTVFINPNNEFNRTIDGFAQGMLHETLHAVLNQYIYSYDAGKLTGKVKVAVERIINLQKEYEKLVSGEEYTKFREEVKKDNPDISQADLSKFYGAVNPREFITMVMTDKEFQRILNDIPYQTSGESFFGKFLELLNKFFDAIGFKVNENSMLKAAISDIVTIIDYKESTDSTTKQFTRKLNARDIYTLLGDKTTSNNVKIESWGNLKDVKTAIVKKGDTIKVVSTRIKDSDEHFGNPFSHEFSGNLIKTSSIREAVEKYINWILTGELPGALESNIQVDDTDLRRTWIINQLKSGNLKGKTILYYKELGEPSHATALDYLINKYDWSKESIESSNSQEEGVTVRINQVFKVSDNLQPFINAFFSNEELITIDNLFKKLTDDDKQILAKSVGRTYKDLKYFDWEEALWSDIGTEEVFYYLTTGNQLQSEVNKVYKSSKLYKEWQEFIKDNKEFVDNFKNLSHNIKVEQQKDYDKLKIKDDWYKVELDKLEYNIRKQLLSNSGYKESSTTTQPKEKPTEVKKVTSIEFQEEQSTGYRERTIKNAKADATIALAVDFTSAGERLTKTAVKDINKKVYIPVDVNNTSITQERVDGIVNMLNSIPGGLYGISLNIAGNGIYTMKGKYTQEQVDNFTYSLLKAVIESPKLKHNISYINTGGQTGFDEAGAKAGIKLGIPTRILAPKGWKYRNIKGEDISDESSFKSRFEEPTELSITLKVKEGVDFVFENTPELSSIGTQQQYSQYLDTVFPDSKVKDIVYHGTRGYDRTTGKELPKFEKFDKERIGKANGLRSDDMAKGFYFGSYNIADRVGTRVIPAILNITDVNSTTVRRNTRDFDVTGDVFVVFEPEQIHILCSNKDIEGFRKFVENEQSALPSTREQLEPAPELPKKLSKYEFTEEEDKLYSSKLHSYTQNIPLKGNELLYKHYNLLNEKGEVKILSNSETVKKWMKFNTVKTKYMFKITQRSSDGLYRPLILEKPNLFSQQLSFKERYNSITDDEVKRNLTKCRGK